MSDIIWETDLFHPYCDMDDYYDLAILFALAQKRLSINGILIDHPPNWPDSEPALTALKQMEVISGITVPACASTPTQKVSPFFLPAKARNTTGSDWLIRLLKKTDKKTDIHIAGSCEDIVSALKEKPELFEEKCSGIYLNAGTLLAPSANPQYRLEYNMTMHTAYFEYLFQGPYTIFWSPCFYALDQEWKAVEGNGGSRYPILQSDIFHEIKEPLLLYFLFALERSKDLKFSDYENRKADPDKVEFFGRKCQDMFCTAGQIWSAGYSVDEAGNLCSRESGVFFFASADIACDRFGNITWNLSPSGRHKMLQIPDQRKYTVAMKKALLLLLKEL